MTELLYLVMEIPVELAKQQLDSLIDRSTAGEDVFLTRNGRLVAKVVPARETNGEHASHALPEGDAESASQPRLPGWGKGVITHISPDFDEPLEDFREYMP